MGHSMLQTSRSNPPEVDSLFKRTEQVVSLSDRKSSDRQNQPASLTVEGFPPKSEKPMGSQKQLKNKAKNLLAELK